MGKPTSYKSTNRPNCCDCEYMVNEFGHYYCNFGNDFKSEYECTEDPWEKRDIQLTYEVEQYGWCAYYEEKVK